MDHTGRRRWRGTIVAAIVLFLSLPHISARQGEFPPRAFDTGNRYFARGEYETAIAYYKEALEGFPSGEWSPEALYLTARCLEELNRWQLAERTYRSVTETYPDSPWVDDALYRLGLHATETLTREGNRLALRTFEDLLRRFPDGNRVLEAKARAAECRFLLGQWEAARATFQEIVDLKPEDRWLGEALFGLGQIHAHPASPDRNLLKAIGYYKRVTEITPPHPRAPSARFAIGTAFRDLKLYDRAIESFQDVVELNPGSLFAPLAQSYLALCLSERREYAQSLEAIESLFQEYPDRGDRLAQDLARLAQSATRGKKLHATANASSFDQERQIATYSGDVEIVHAGLLIRAQEARVYLKTRRIEAEGSVRLVRSDGLLLTGERLALDLRTREAAMEGQAELVQPDRVTRVNRDRIVYDLNIEATPTSPPGT